MDVDVSDIESADEKDQSTSKTTGKFSSQETTLIINFIDDFVQSHDLTLADVIPQMREFDDDKYRRKVVGLWSELGELLPNRSVKSLQSHATRKLMKKHGYFREWTEEEDATLKQLLEQHGPQWKIIGKLMKRHDDDLKGRAERMKGRVNTGKFTEDEDALLLLAIKKHVGKKAETVAKIEDVGLPWKAVATTMKNMRLPRDYCRRWALLRSHIVAEGRDTITITKESAACIVQEVGSAAGRKSVGGSVVDNSTVTSVKDRNSQLVQLLTKMDPEDESDITWSAIDRKLRFVLGEARQRWCSMKKACPFHIQQLGFPSILERLKRKYTAVDGDNESSDYDSDRPLWSDSEGEVAAEQVDQGEQGEVGELDADNSHRKSSTPTPNANLSGSEDNDNGDNGDDNTSIAAEHPVAIRSMPTVVTTVAVPSSSEFPSTTASPPISNGDNTIDAYSSSSASSSSSTNGILAIAVVSSDSKTKVKKEKKHKHKEDRDKKRSRESLEGSGGNDANGENGKHEKKKHRKEKKDKTINEPQL